MNDDATVQRAADAAARLALGGRVLDLRAGMLRDAASGEPVELRPQVWAVLQQLAQHVGRVVTKDELLDAVWPGLVVTDGSVTQAISDVRAALGDDAHRIVKTLPRRGYMLVADAPADAAPADAEPGPQLALHPSVAVLPFADPSGDPAGRQLARGLAQDLVAELARNIGLRVVSHHSSFALADAATPLAQIGERLRCRYLADGTVRREGEVLHVVLELIDSQGGDVVWSQRYTAVSSDALEKRSAMVERIAGTVLSRVIHRRDRTALLSSHAPKTLDVYAMTLRGIALRREGTAEALREGRALLEQALAIDPQYAPAWSALGYLNVMDIWLGTTGEWDRQRSLEAAAQAERGIALGFEEAEAYIAVSVVRRLQGRYDEGSSTAARAVAVGPSDVHAWHNLADAQYRLGRLSEALHSAERAMDLNPMPSAWTLRILAAALWANRRHDEAVRAAGEALVQLPRLWPCLALRMFSLFELERVAEASDEATRLLARLPRLSAAGLANTVANEAVELRERIFAAARGSGIPA